MKKTNEHILNQLKEMHISMENNLQTYITTQISAQIATLREQISLFPKTEPHHTYQPRTPKITLTPFDGSNPLNWIFQEEQFFELHNTPTPENVASSLLYARAGTRVV